MMNSWYCGVEPKRDFLDCRRMPTAVYRAELAPDSTRITVHNLGNAL